MRRCGIVVVGTCPSWLSSALEALTRASQPGDVAPGWQLVVCPDHLRPLAETGTSHPGLRTRLVADDAAARDLVDLYLAGHRDVLPRVSGAGELHVALAGRYDLTPRQRWRGGLAVTDPIVAAGVRLLGESRFRRSPEAIATCLGLGIVEVSRRFVADLGIAPAELAASMRADLRDYLLACGLGARAVSQALGFPKPSSFEASVRRESGMTAEELGASLREQAFVAPERSAGASSPAPVIPHGRLDATGVHAGAWATRRSAARHARRRAASLTA